MKRLLLFTCLLALPFSHLAAQDAQKSLASTLEVYVFPAAGQAADQQSKDEVECYSWAVSNTGSDPFDLQEQHEAVSAQADQQVAQTEAATQGPSGGAIKGAAAGALIGEVSGGDAGDSAAIGAAVGLVASRRRGRAANRQAEEQAAQATEASHQATQEQTENFKKAFSVCLEAKEYMVKS